MCGIIGILDQHNNVSDRIVEALAALEYRGYDSAGIATIHNGKFVTRKVVGRVQGLKELCDRDKVFGLTGIGHTRWATHGAPSIENTHPLIVLDVAVVHNGIIENYKEIRDYLQNIGQIFCSATDTEVISALISHYITKGQSKIDAIYAAINQLRGVFSCVIMFVDDSRLLCGVQRGLSLVLGVKGACNYIASDASAIAAYVDDVIYLEDNSLAIMKDTKYAITDLEGCELIAKTSTIDKQIIPSKAGYATYMLKEINEQSKIIYDLFNADYVATGINWDQFDTLQIIACGSSLHAAQIAKYWIEGVARKKVDIEIASEFMLQTPLLNNRTVYVFISQSGETADTLLVLKYAKRHKMATLGIVNVLESQISRLVDHLVLLRAGKEIAVASTKTFTAQLAILLLLTLEIAAYGNIDNAKNFYSADLSEIALINTVLQLEQEVILIAKKIAGAKKILYIGRGTSYPVALEGALKMKELAYIPGEGHAAGELKHGPIALIDDRTPVIAIAPPGHTFVKMMSNIQEVRARCGKIVLLTSEKEASQLKGLYHELLLLPRVHELLTPIFYSIPLQMLAYHTAVLSGLDVDKPRNLAKSVTVE
ncbi:Glutamine--fructose-6-phosphate aminotransferase (isomerizing) [Alphaproteobacteria bacterium]